MARQHITRRLAAILAADVVGFSRLMREDEVGTLAALKAHREQVIEPKIAEYHGRIVKLMGDGILAEFGSVVDAASCAVDVQRAMSERNSEISDGRRIRFRVGINLGDVITEGDDIYGDGVNIAARLEGLAEPGGICISGSVFDEIKNKLDWFFDVSNGIEEVSERGGDQVDHGDVGGGVSVSACLCPSGLEETVEALHAGVAVA